MVMFEFIVLILTSVTLLIAAIVVLFRSKWLRSKEVDRMKQTFQGTAKKLMVASHVCAHQFGYLGTLPKDKPIPEECMGCSDIFKCLAHKKRRRKKKRVRAVTRASKMSVQVLAL